MPRGRKYNDGEWSRRKPQRPGIRVSTPGKRVRPRDAVRPTRPASPVGPSPQEEPVLPAGEASPEPRYEAEVVPGLEEFVRSELVQRFGSRVSLTKPRAPTGHREADRDLPTEDGAKPGNVPFAYAGDVKELLTLGTAGSVYLVKHFGVPRPLALLGHQNFQQLAEAIATVVALHPLGSFHTLRISAAGERSSVFERLRAELASRTELQSVTGEGGDLVMRVRRPVAALEGFEVSVRISPRPLSARPWRVCDMPGALNATVARVMAHLTAPRADDVFLNLAAGSGTLCIERLAYGPAREVIGAERDPEALECTRANLRAAGLGGHVRLERWDAGNVPLPSGSVTALTSDLPWGHLIGGHEENERLYPRILEEGARLAAPDARLVLLSSEVRLLERLLSQRAGMWTVERTIRLNPGGTPLRIYVLARTRA